MVGTFRTLANALAVSPNEAASLLSIGRTRLYQEISSGKLRSFKLGRRRMIPVAAIEDWIVAREAEAEHADPR